MPSVNDLTSNATTSPVTAGLTWVYPTDAHSTWETSTFVLGSFTFPAGARSGVVMLKQGADAEPVEVPLTVSPALQRVFFAHRIDLNPGDNKVTLTLLIDDQVIKSQTRTIVRSVASDLAALWSQSITEPYAWAWPTEAITLMDQTCLKSQGFYVGFWGPEGLTDTSAQLQLNSRRITVALTPMTMADDTQRSQFAQRHQLQAPLPQKGVWYGALVSPLAMQDWPDVAVKTLIDVTYKAMCNGQPRVIKPTATFTLDPSAHSAFTQPWFRLIESATAKRGSPTGVPLTPRWLPATRVQGVMKQGDWVAVSAMATGHQPHWQQASDWVWLPESALEKTTDTGWAMDYSMTPRYPAITQVRASLEPLNDGWVSLAIPLPFPVPVSWQADSTTLTVTLAGVSVLNEWVVLPESVHQLGVQAFSWLPESIVGKATFQLHLSHPLWGVQVGYDENKQELVVMSRTTKGLQSALTSRPFRLMLDPGHGGDETGASALDGSLEKGLNLALANACVSMGHQFVRHVEILSTRHEDALLSLVDRVAYCEDAKPDLILSLHHNALPDGRDPQLEQGWSTFYWHGFAKPVAQLFQTQAVTGLKQLFADYGVIQTDFAMTRLSIAPSLLLECGFLTHPDDADHCLRPDFPQRAARVILNALQALQTSIWSTR